jgi:hypothetical protein
VAHGDETVAVDQVNFARREDLGTLGHLTRHVRRVVINDERIGIDAHSGKQTACFAVPGFDVRDVCDTTSKDVGTLVDHPLQHEGMDAVAGPSMSDGEGFNHEEGEVALNGKVDSMLEREVVVGAA